MQALCLLSKSFVSPLLLETLQKYRVPVFAEPGLCEQLPPGLLLVNAAQAEALLSDASTKVYANAEDGLPFVLSHARPALAEGIRLFKDKARCRRALAALAPDYFFTELKRDALRRFIFPAGKNLLVKPAIGFHSLGIRRVSSQAEWDAAVPVIIDEIKRYRKTFSEEVVSADRFLVEDFIEGEEFACDAFFDAQGEPQITGLYHHPFASADDSRDVVYYTSQAILQKWWLPVAAFLRRLGEQAHLVSFPVHMEFRVAPAGILRLIEVNPLRFGGFGLADLPLHAFGINPYECFLLDKAPGWEALLSKPDAASYAFVLGQAPEKLGPAQAPDHAKFKRTFREILDYRPVDHTHYKFFATVYTKTEDKNELFKYLHFDFGEYAGG